MKKLFTSESVTEGHPDKLCDYISDSILDACLEQDKNSRVAVEMMTKLIINDSEHKYTCVFEKKYGMDGLLIGYERICE